MIDIVEPGVAGAMSSFLWEWKDGLHIEKAFLLICLEHQPNAWIASTKGFDTSTVWYIYRNKATSRGRSPSPPRLATPSR